MKRIVCIVFIVLLMIGSGVAVYAVRDNTEQKNNDSSLNNAIKEEKQWSLDRMKTILAEYENLEFNFLKPTSYQWIIEFAPSRYCPDFQKYRSFLGSDILGLQTICDIDYAIMPDEEHLIVATPVIKDKLPEGTAFILFRREVLCDSETGRVWEKWEQTGEVYFVGAKKSSLDYSGIVPGSLIDELVEVDPSTSYDLLHMEPSVTVIEQEREKTGKTWIEGYVNQCMIYKILSDGLLRIEYSASEGIILSIEVFPFSGEMPPYVSDCISVIPGLLE